MKVTDIISQSDSQCFTPGYLSAHNLTERVQRGALCFLSVTPYSLPTPWLPHPFTVSPVCQLLKCFGGGPYTSMLLRCFSTTIIFLTFASPPFCCFFVFFPPCQHRAVFGLSELFPRALIGYWMLSFFFNQVFWSWPHVSSVRLCTIISHPVILCLLKLSKMIFGVGRQTSVSKETSMTFTSLLTIFRPSYVSLFVSLPVIIHRLLCFVKFSVCQPRSVWPCLCVSVCERKRVCVWALMLSGSVWVPFISCLGHIVEDFPQWVSV